jgi:hypothetical protein
MRSSWTGLLSLVAVAAGSVGAAGCGSVASSNDGGGTDSSVETAPPTVAQACDQFATALCSRLDGCAPYALQIFYGDMTTCASRVTLGCMRDLEVPDTNQTTTDMAACARDAANATCDDLVANVVPTSCQIKPGLRRDGEGCGSSWQCASTHCEKTDGDCGVCAPRAAASGACTVDEGCTVGLVCGAQKCVAPAAIGAACGAAAPCRANLYCSAASNTCIAPLALGAACANDTGACDFRHGVMCNTFAPMAMQKCEMIAAAKGGQACGLVNNTFTVCIELNSCQGISLIPLQTMGVCPNTAADGAQCTDSVHCLPPASCVGGLCRLPSTGSCTK